MIRFGYLGFEIFSYGAEKEKRLEGGIREQKNHDASQLKQAKSTIATIYIQERTVPLLMGHSTLFIAGRVAAGNQRETFPNAAAISTVGCQGYCFPHRSRLSAIPS